jgi:hypothetical protein
MPVSAKLGNDTHSDPKHRTAADALASFYPMYAVNKKQRGVICEPP